MELLVVTGLSGAGKTQALNSLEDLGYFCMDNMPLNLLEAFLDHADEDYQHVALVLDLKYKNTMEDLMGALDLLRERVEDMKIIYLEASRETLIKRYKESRRPHPFSLYLSEGIKMENERMSEIRKMADLVINTDHLTNQALKIKLQTFISETEQDTIISIVSFGFKYGVLEEGDIIYDVRFIPNPYYIDELKRVNGTQKATYDYVLQWEVSQVFLDKVEDYLLYFQPLYKDQGRNVITVGLGCTGGFHRSVALAVALAKRLESKGHKVLLSHREEESKW